MAQKYASLSDITTLWRVMSAEEEERAEALLPLVCASLRAEANKVGKDLDKMIQANEDLAEVAKSVTVDVVARTLMTATNQEPMTQMSQSRPGLRHVWNLPGPGGGLFIKRSELARLGLRRQRYGVMTLYGDDQGN